MQRGSSGNFYVYKKPTGNHEVSEIKMCLPMRTSGLCLRLRFDHMGYLHLSEYPVAEFSVISKLETKFFLFILSYSSSVIGMLF